MPNPLELQKQAERSDNEGDGDELPTMPAELLVKHLEFELLPPELIVKILLFLNSKDRTNAAHACRLLREAVIATQNELPHREEGQFMHHQHAVEFRDCLEAAELKRRQKRN